MMLFLCCFRERLDVALVARDDGLRAGFLGKALEIELVDRLPETVRVIEDEGSAPGGLPAEQDSRLRPPWGGAGIERGVRSQPEHVDLVEGDGLGLGARFLKRLEEALAAGPFPDRHPADVRAQLSSVLIMKSDGVMYITSCPRFAA